MADSGSSSSSSSTSTKSSTPATTETSETSVGEEMIDNATKQERARIKQNQADYDAIVGGKSQAEINEEKRQKALKDNPPPEAAKKGGQVTIEDDLADA